jgi:putative ABC transport system ATP-binding protein
MGIIFQDKNLIDSFNVFDNLLLPFFIIKKKITTDVIMKIDNLMKRFDIFDLKNRSIDKLSGGQKQKVAIVRALVLNPIIIFADEPTGGLDKESETELMEIFKKINETDNTTILMVTHSDYCASYAKSIVKLEKDVL